MAGRTLVDKAMAAGFEHSVAKMYLMPLAMPVQQSAGAAAGPAVTWPGMAGNLLPVIAGNLLGGSVLVGLSYHLIYRQGAEAG